MVIKRYLLLCSVITTMQAESLQLEPKESQNPPMEEEPPQSPSVNRTVPDKVIDITSHIPSREGFQISFYSGYSSFKNKLCIKTSAPGSDILNNAQTDSALNNIIEVQAEGNVKEQYVPELLNRIEEKAPQPENKDQTVCKVEKRGVIRGTRKMYQFNRVIKNWDGERKRSMIRKLTRGIWSISSRKYQPNQNLKEIFDEDQLSNNIVGLDECRLWMYLMNKYIEKPKASKKAKLKKESKNILVTEEPQKPEEQQPKKKKKPAKKSKKNAEADNIKKEDLGKIEEKAKPVPVPPQLKKIKEIEAVPWNKPENKPEKKSEPQPEVKVEVKQEWVDPSKQKNETESKAKKKTRRTQK